MSSPLVYITDKEVQTYLTWNEMIPAMKQVLRAVSGQGVIQPARTLMPIPHKNGMLLTMPGMCQGTLGCKLVTAFPDNQQKFNIPSILATILLFNSDSGKLEAVLDGQTITEWRTAAASVVAVEQLWPNWKDTSSLKTLSIIGAGRQGRSHILALKHQFNFNIIRLWNRSIENAVVLADELKHQHNIDVEVCPDIVECVKNSDVIVTATHSSIPLLKLEHLTKKDAVICAVGAGINHHSELDPDIYSHSQIYVDSWANSLVELKGLIDNGYDLVGEIGKVIQGSILVDRTKLKVFHSLGMAVEDTASARLVYDAYMKDKKK